MDSQLKEASNMIILPKRSDLSFDAMNIVSKVEGEVREKWDASPPEAESDFQCKLRKAHELLSKKADSITKEPIARFQTDDSKNEWDTFARLEEERRAFIEASYRRFRCGPVPDAPLPMRDHFDYDHTDITLASGDVVQHPVAFVREPNILDHHAGKDRYRSDVNRFTVGVNTDEVDSQAIEETRKPLVHPQPREVDRQAYISNLVQKKAMSVDPIRPGRTVEVAYYGVSFPGVVLKRNIGSGSVSIRFDDGTENDFPLHAIRFKN